MTTPAGVSGPPTPHPGAWMPGEGCLWLVFVPGRGCTARWRASKARVRLTVSCPFFLQENPGEQFSLNRNSGFFR